jgi:hypothetical protein
MGGLWSRMKTFKARFGYLLVIVRWFFATGCTNIGLLSKLEAPGGGTAQGDPIYAVSTNISTNLSTGGSLAATVTFNRAVNHNSPQITLDNGGAISAHSSADISTWPFTIDFAMGGAHNLTLLGITDAVGRVMNPYTYAYSVTFV